MSLRTRILITVGILVLIAVGGFAAIYILAEGSARNAEKFMAPVNGVMFFVTVLSLGGLWLPWAYQVGQKRREAQQKQQKKKKRR